MEPKFRLKAAAKELGLGYSTLRSLVKRGQIGIVSLGRNTNFIPESELKAFQERRTQRYLNVI